MPIIEFHSESTVKGVADIRWINTDNVRMISFFTLNGTERVRFQFNENHDISVEWPKEDFINQFRKWVDGKLIQPPEEETDA